MEDLLTHASAILAITAGRWADLTARISPELLVRQPAPGQWSTLECLQHLVDTEPVFRSRVRAFLAGQDFPAFDPDSQGTLLDTGRPAAELARTFAGLREESLAALSELGPG